MTMAPLVVKDKVIVGVAEASLAFVASSPPSRRAPERKPGDLIRFPSPANPVTKVGATAIGTWQRRRLGHGSYDPDLNLTYWGTGNPGPDWNPEQRPGDNLYSDSAVALDRTLENSMYFQFTPGDPTL